MWKKFSEIRMKIIIDNVFVNLQNAFHIVLWKGFDLKGHPILNHKYWQGPK